MAISPQQIAAAARATGPGGAPLSIDDVCQRITEVSSLPHIALKVMEVANDPNAGAADLRAIVEGDPALSARLLKVVNSAAHGLRTRVTSLQRAISFLGFKQVRNLAVTLSVSEAFKNHETHGKYTRSGLWKHMVSVAVCARFIATRKKLPYFEEAFLAGLLHDIGIILEDQYCQARFHRVMAMLEPGMTLCQVEQQVIGFDHTRLGARIAETWKFPGEVLDSIRFHHMPQNYRGDHGEVLACVDLANLLCTLHGTSSVGHNLLKPSLWPIERLGMTKADVKVLANDLPRELELNQPLFKL